MKSRTRNLKRLPSREKETIRFIQCKRKRERKNKNAKVDKSLDAAETTNPQNDKEKRCFSRIFSFPSHFSLLLRLKGVECYLATKKTFNNSWRCVIRITTNNGPRKWFCNRARGVKMSFVKNNTRINFHNTTNNNYSYCSFTLTHQHIFSIRENMAFLDRICGWEVFLFHFENWKFFKFYWFFPPVKHSIFRHFQLFINIFILFVSTKISMIFFSLAEILKIFDDSILHCFGYFWLSNSQC